MPDEKRRRGFNLIKKDVNFREAVSEQKDWYVLLNIIVISIVGALSILAFLLNFTIKTSIRSKAGKLAAKINTDLNTETKSSLKGQINELENKYTIYNDFLDQNFDVNKLYEDLNTVYPGIRVSRVIVQPGTDTVSLTLVFDANGYKDISKFIDALDKSDRFHYYSIKGVNFSSKDLNGIGSKSLADFKDATSSFLTEINIDVQKRSTVATSK